MGATLPFLVVRIRDDSRDSRFLIISYSEHCGVKPCDDMLLCWRCLPWRRACPVPLDKKPPARPRSSPTCPRPRTSRPARRFATTSSASSSTGACYSVLGRGEWVMQNEKMPIDEVRAARRAVQPREVQRRRVGAALQAGRRQVRHDHVEAPRRLLHVGLASRPTGTSSTARRTARTCSSSSPRRASGTG